MAARPIQVTKSAYQYPLLIKQLWHTPLLQAPDQEIVYRDLRRFTYRQLRERIGRLASSLARLGVARRRHRRRARLGQQPIPGGLLCRSNDGSSLADGERPSVAGTDRLYDQSRGLVGASRQRRLRPGSGRYQAATAQGEDADPDVGSSGAPNRRAFIRRRI